MNRPPLAPWTDALGWFVATPARVVALTAALVFVFLAAIHGYLSPPQAATTPGTTVPLAHPPPKMLAIFVDGLRPENVDPLQVPVLWRRKTEGFYAEVEPCYDRLTVPCLHEAFTGTVNSGLLGAATMRRITPFDGNPHAETSTTIAIDWMANQDGPFYAYIHYFDPHWPYAPPGVDSACMVNDIADTEITRGQMMFQNKLPEAENARARELYREEVGYTEQQVQRVFDWLRESGLEDDTLVVFTADHGHHLGDHGYYYHHGEFLYEPGVQIPLVMRWPGEIEAGSRVAQQVRSIDIMPTVLGLLGIKHKGMDGVNALEVTPPLAILETDISYFKENTRRYVKGVTGKVRGVRTSDWKLVYSPRKGEGKWELFDLRVDRDEARDLVAAGAAPAEVMLPLMAALGDSLPKREREALAKLGNHFDRMPTGAAAAEGSVEATDTDPMSETDRAMLRSLGYVE